MRPCTNLSFTTYNPSTLSSSNYLYYWRNLIGKWVDFIKFVHKAGQDRSLNKMFKVIGQILFKQALPREKQALVDEGQRKGTNNYLQTEDAVKTVLGIVKIVAVDVSMSKVTQKTTSFNRVTCSTRSKKANIKAFADRFSGLTPAHFEHVSAITSFQVGQVLAVTVLNNANLEESSLTSTKLQLIFLTEERCKTNIEYSVKEVKFDRLKELIGIAVKLNEKIANIVFELSDLANDSDFLNLHHQLSVCIKELNPQDREDGSFQSVAHLFMPENKYCKLLLDDAVLALRKSATKTARR